MSLLADTIAVAHGWSRLEVKIGLELLNFQNSENIKKMTCESRILEPSPYQLIPNTKYAIDSVAAGSSLVSSHHWSFQSSSALCDFRWIENGTRGFHTCFSNRGHNLPSRCKKWTLSLELIL